MVSWNLNTMRFVSVIGHPLLISWEYDDWCLGQGYGCECFIRSQDILRWTPPLLKKYPPKDTSWKLGRICSTRLVSLVAAKQKHVVQLIHQSTNPSSERVWSPSHELEAHPIIVFFVWFLWWLFIASCKKTVDERNPGTSCTLTFD